MQSYATAKPSVGLLPSMGRLCFYDREWRLPWAPGSRVTSVTYKCGLQSEISVSVASV